MKKIRLVVIICIILSGVYFLNRDYHTYLEIINKIITSDFERSLASDNEAIENNPHEPWNYVFRAETYAEHQKYQKALEDYYKALELDKKMSNYVCSDISNLYLVMGNTKKAYEYINKPIKTAPFPEAYFFDLAIIFDYEWKSKEALNMYGKYIKNFNMKNVKKRHIFAVKRKIVFQVLLQKYSDAQKSLKELVRLKPDDPEIDRLSNLVESKEESISNIRENFELNVYEAIVSTTRP